LNVDLPRVRNKGMLSSQRLIAVSTVLVLSFAFTACRGSRARVYRVRKAPIHAASSKDIGPDQVRIAIVTSLRARRWLIEEDEGAYIIATLANRGNFATVRIDYASHTYSINHLKSSKGLKFTGKTVHKTYNNWVKRLHKTIKKQMRRM